jgi:hypothetical protein
VTDCELATLRYAQSRFEWTEEAKAWVFGNKGVVASVEAGNDAPLDETRNAKREDDAGVGVVENAEDDEDDDAEDDEDDDVEDDEDDDMEDSSDSDTSSDTSSSDSDSDSSPLQKQTWSTLDARRRSPSRGARSLPPRKPPPRRRRPPGRCSKCRAVFRSAKKTKTTELTRANRSCGASAAPPPRSRRATPPPPRVTF